jgi:hypothetical protein
MTSYQSSLILAPCVDSVSTSVAIGSHHEDGSLLHVKAEGSVHGLASLPFLSLTAHLSEMPNMTGFVFARECS